MATMWAVLTVYWYALGTVVTSALVDRAHGRRGEVSDHDHV